MSQTPNRIDEGISSLFNDAIKKLDKIDAQAKQEKKQIIIELAKNLIYNEFYVAGF